jgi:fructose-1,6-bisphosphatase/inositol monophosphatase family enzyme
MTAPLGFWLATAGLSLFALCCLAWLAQEACCTRPTRATRYRRAGTLALALAMTAAGAMLAMEG